MTNIKNIILKKYYNFLIFSEKYFEEDNNIFIKKITDFLYYINFYFIYIKNKTNLYFQKLLKNNNINDDINNDNSNITTNDDTSSITSSDASSDIDNTIDNTICNVNDKINNNISINLDNDTMFVNKQNQQFFNNVNKYFDQNNLYRKLYSTHLIASSIKRNNDRREYLKIKIATKILQKHFKVYRLNKSKYENDNISKSENLSDDNTIENYSYFGYLSNSLNYFKW